MAASGGKLPYSVAPQAERARARAARAASKPGARGEETADKGVETAASKPGARATLVAAGARAVVVRVVVGGGAAEGGVTSDHEWPRGLRVILGREPSLPGDQG